MKLMYGGLRLQVVTVVAVFLALGFGMAAGGAILADEGLIPGYDALVTALEADFARLREDGRRQRARLETLTAELAATRSQLDYMVEWAVQGQLTGQRIAVVVVGGADLPGNLDSTLRKAGAEVLSVSRIMLPTGPDGAPSSPAMSPGPSGGPSAARALATALASPGQTPAIEQLEAASGLAIAGDFRSAPTAVLLIAGPAGEVGHDPDEVDLALARMLRTAGIRVVGAGAEAAAAGKVARYRRAGVPSVDRLDHAIELVRAVYLLAGSPGLPDESRAGPSP